MKRLTSAFMAILLFQGSLASAPAFAQDNLYADWDPPDTADRSVIVTGSGPPHIIARRVAPFGGFFDTEYRVGANLCAEFQNGPGEERNLRVGKSHRLKLRSVAAKGGCTFDNDLVCRRGLFVEEGYLRCVDQVTSKVSLDGGELANEALPPFEAIAAINAAQPELARCPKCGFGESSWFPVRHQIRWGKHQFTLRFERHAGSATVAILDSENSDRDPDGVFYRFLKDESLRMILFRPGRMGVFVNLEGHNAGSDLLKWKSQVKPD